MSRLSYTAYLRDKKCCDFMGPGPFGKQGPAGPDGIGYTGYNGYTGSTGSIGSIGPSRKGDTGPTGTGSPGNKTFIIDHPNDQTKCLVHACLEGPEVGVFYRGQGEIINNFNTTIILPEYVKQLATDFTVKVTAIYDGKIKIYNFAEVENNSFNVYGENGKFNWLVIGKRYDIEVEPNKTNVDINGNGPYLWL